MNLKKRAEADIKKITGNINEWADEATLTDPVGGVFTVNVIHTKHHLGLDPEIGVPINAKTASIAFSESNLSASVRNGESEVNLDGWQIDVADSTEVSKSYYALEWFPDEMIGMIVVILSDKKP
tara:strand:+ start:246 stop:617 length:372 start_codon:yes stop_codon:yes gene_type:complete